MKKIIFLLFMVLSLTACKEETPKENLKTDNTIEVIDTEAPIISLIGEKVEYITRSKVFVDQGATAIDNIDMEIEITVSGEIIDTSFEGIHTITYNAVDSAGNIAKQVTRTVYVTKKKPGIISSVTYETETSVSFLVQVFDHDTTLVDLSACLYNGDTLIEEIKLNESRNNFKFTNLISGVDYDYILKGKMNLGSNKGIDDFQKDPIKVGVYRKLSDSFKEKLNNDSLFESLYDFIYLPYNKTNLNKAEIMVLDIAKIDEELLIALAATEERVILVNSNITGVEDYFHLKGVKARGMEDDTTYDDIPGVCCSPTVAKIGYSGKSLNLVLHEVGHAIDIVVFSWLSESQEFQDILSQEKQIMFPDEDYYEYPEEYFAECFAFYFHSDYTRQRLKENAPKTHNFIESLVSRLESIIE